MKKSLREAPTAGMAASKIGSDLQLCSLESAKDPQT